MSQTQINDVDNGDTVLTGEVPGDAPGSVADPVVCGLKRSVWIQIAVITALFSALFWPNLRRLWDKTNPFYGEANWGHAICIPLIGLYYLYVNREKLLHGNSSGQPTRRQMGLRVWGMLALAVALPLALIYEEARRVIGPAAMVGAAIVAAPLVWNLLRNSDSLVQRADERSAGWFGGFVVLFGIAVFQYAIFPGQNDFLKDLGMVITLFGVVLALSGWSVMKVAWFPIAFLVCGLPWPGLVYSRVAEPLQQLAANVAVWTLQLTGVEASVGGTKISMVGGDGNWRTLNVAEACAGMRSLMTFISVAAAVAFLSNRPLWQKIIVVLFAVPIAISCNVMRVSGQGLLDRYVSHSLSENFAHQFVGLIMLVPAFLMILLVGWILDQIFVEQIDRRFVAIAPKVITRSTAPVASALPPRAAPRSLASIRGASTPPQPVAQPPKAAAAPAKPATAPVKPAKLGPSSPKSAVGPRRAAGDMSSIVPPPPSIRLALRSPSPRKRRDNNNGDSNSQTEAG
ncbi:MAG: exosortase/archaeosortase family protein [Tepidisphaeraceae bacterium]|jgi:exosortase